MVVKVRNAAGGSADEEAPLMVVPGLLASATVAELVVTGLPPASSIATEKLAIVAALTTFAGWVLKPSWLAGPTETPIRDGGGRRGQEPVLAAVKA